MWSGLEWELRRMFSFPGSRAWWQKARSAFNPELRDYMERTILGEDPDPKP